MKNYFIFIACGVNLLLSLTYMLFVNYNSLNIPTEFWSKFYYLNDKILIILLVIFVLKLQHSSIEILMCLLYIVFQLSIIIFIFVAQYQSWNSYMIGMTFSIFIVFNYILLLTTKYSK